MNVLVILGHPRKDSYCAALAKAYVRGAEAAGANVKNLILADLQFEMNVLVPSPEHQFLEEDILKAKELISWADHLVFIYPTWWGNVPALLKAFLDRTIMPGFAFRELQFDAYDKMLAPRTAQLITTMDTPLFVYKLFYGSPGTKALTNATLKFCGVNPVRNMYLSPVKHSSKEKKQEWLQRVYDQGRALQYGVLTPWEKFWRKAKPWVQAIRLQFYPMTFLAYGIGAFCADILGYGFSWLLFLLGYIFVFLLEVAVVFSNDYYDFESDKINKNFSPFSGGSRVLVDKLISPDKFKQAIRWLLIVCTALMFLIAYVSPAPIYILIPVVLIFSFIAMSYTVSPLKLSHRGWGEVTVGFTHSFAIILTGFLFQGGMLNESLPWLISIPLFFSIVPAIIMSGMPDYYADKTSGKNTLVVLLGRDNATIVAVISILAAIFSALFLYMTNTVENLYGWEVLPITAHGYLLVKMLIKFYKQKDKPARIDAIMAVSLMFIMWFALAPFIRLL